MIGALLDLIWPRSCAVCERPVDRPGRYLCTDCLMRLPLVPTRGLCRVCGRDAAGLDHEFLCEDCRGAHAPQFDRVGSALRFEGEARELVNAFKFRRAFFLRNDLVDLLEAAARTRFRLAEIGGIIPMPATLPHRFMRGYNQCVYLARPLAKRLELPYVAGILRRVGSPRRQGSLSENERRKNVVGTFAVSAKGLRYLKNFPSDKVLLLVDDIMTTGSTLNEAAHELKAVRPDLRVYAVTLARSVRD